MYISKTGGIIGAASRKRARPLRQTGRIPAVRRIVLTMQQAGVFPIAVVIGRDEAELKFQLAKDHVIFLTSEDDGDMSLFETVRAGLNYLSGKCDNMLFTPVNAPLFTADTVLALLSDPSDIVTPVYDGRSGHPVLIRDRAAGDILSYEGDEGLRGAIRAFKGRRGCVEVKDSGILSLNQTDEGIDLQVPRHNRSLLHPSIRISMGNEDQFFNDRLKLLLFLIADLENVKLACESMAISKGKAWNMINALEDKIGFPVVARKQGGKQGGRTSLTEKGELFLRKWQRYEEEVYAFSQERYKEIFDRSEEKSGQTEDGYESVL